MDMAAAVALGGVIADVAAAEEGEWAPAAAEKAQGQPREPSPPRTALGDGFSGEAVMGRRSWDRPCGRGHGTVEGDVALLPSWSSSFNCSLVSAMHSNGTGLRQWTSYFGAMVGCLRKVKLLGWWSLGTWVQ